MIGGGFGGIAAAARLRHAGFDDVVVFERSAGLGGTWFDNRYPGAETDAPSHLYCYSFAPYAWTRSHVRQPELQAYLEHVVDRFDLRRHFRFGHDVSSLTWDEQSQEYVVVSTSGEERFHAVICAVGMFTRPRYPDLPGLEEFHGAVAHTARWDAALDVTGKRVAVIGTGSSASQVAPTLAGTAAHVLVFQRQPAWLLPKGDHDFSARQLALWRLPGMWKLHRAMLYAGHNRRELGGRLFNPASRVNRAARARATANIERVLGGRPDLMAAVTYDFGGKRAILSSAFYESLLRPDVELVPRGVVRATARGVVDSVGVEHEADVIVLATGFEGVGYLRSLEVVGRQGTRVHDVWQGEPFAFLA